MYRVTFVTFLALATASLLAFARDGQHKEEKGQQVTIVGELVDTACFVTSAGKEMGTAHAQCAAGCVESGTPAGILPEGSKEPKAMLFLLTNPAPLAEHAAKTIKVEGQSFPEMHAFYPEKLYVKSGTEWQEVTLKDQHHGGGQDHEKHGHDDHDHGHHKKDGG